MIALSATIRGLLHRGGSTLMIFVVALVAAAAATAGPAYYSAARASILHDAFTNATYLGRGYEVNQTGSVDTLIDPFSSLVQAELAADVGTRDAHRLFAPTIRALEALLGVPALPGASIVWRSGVCAHLHITGTCPAAVGQVIISDSTARITSWRVGQRLSFPSWPKLMVTGIYRVPSAAADYWFGRGPNYFPYEMAGPSSYDAMFTPESTLAATPGATQGTAIIDDLLNVSALRPSDAAPLSEFANFVNSPALQGAQAVVTSNIPDTFGSVQLGWGSVTVPIELITAQLLVVAWLLLFLAVTDAAEARGPEIALAKLRGQGRWRTVVFGLSEPALLLALALPFGALAGWGATIVLARVLLSSGTPVGLPALGWVAAAAAAIGGLVAVVLAARRTIRRPVVEQWRRSGRRAADRSWVVDGILLTGAAAGLLELAVGGEIGPASRSALVLLVPGLFGLAVGVVASRLLPLGCRAAFGRTGGRGGIGRYLALRHIARRPGGVRTTMMLATSFALAAFAVTAWSVARNNYRLVADAQVGAPEVLTVSVPEGKDLGTIVGRADPGGRRATAVDVFISVTSGSTGQVTLGVDPARFARIAAWHRGYAAQPLQTIAARLAPPAPPPITTSGDGLRITATVLNLSDRPADLVADVHVTRSIGVTPFDLGRLPSHGTFTRTSQLFGCPCTLKALYLSPQPAGRAPPPTVGRMVLNRLELHTAAGWTSGNEVFASAARWRAGTADTPPDRLTVGPAGLEWDFNTPGRQSPTLDVVDRPVPLPAIVATTLSGGQLGDFSGSGLDGAALEMRAIASASAVPGAPSSGIIVDRSYAERAANDNLFQVRQQVWLAAGARRIIAPKLAAAGVRVQSDQSAVATAALLGRQGPGLATVLFLADAAAAALLAAGAAILGLWLSARRRRYEYAALSATGVQRRTLRRALLIEQSVVLGFGTLVGLGAGLAVAVLLLHDLPEFPTPPVAPPLSYALASGQLAALLGVAVAVLLVAAVTASGTLIHGVDLDQLREAPP